MSRSTLRLRGSLVAVLLISLVWLGCTDSRDLAAPDDLGPNILIVDQVAFDRAIRVQEAHTEELMAFRAVVGTAVGLTADGQPAVKILTSEAGVAGLPESLEGVPVMVEVTGMIVALRALADPTLRFDRPVPIGVSTGHPSITAGTIGARVTDGTDVFALSNNHVYADVNEANIGDDVIQPGAFDGGALPGDFIGSLYDFEKIEFARGNKIRTNIMDAAMVRSSTDMLGNATPVDGYGVPSTTIVQASIDLPVKKYGRTTKLTSGQVFLINATVDVCYAGFVVCTKFARFVEQIVIVDGTFSGGGDSGSLVVTQNGNNPVALLFAGSSTHTIASPIGPILDQFEVTIDASPPAAPPTLTSISVTPTSASIGVGQTRQFTATGTFSDNTTSDITATAAWSSTDELVATVAAGLSTGVAVGSATISATQDGTSNSAALTVTAPPMLQSIAVTPAAAAVEVSATQQFTAIGTFSDNNTADITATATWSSSNELFATVDAGGSATGVGEGTATISATQDGIPSNDATLTVNPLTVGTAPTVDACSPPSGNRDDRFTVMVSGSNFVNGASANFGRQIKIRDVLFVSLSRLDVEIEVHKKAPTGPRDVTVTNPDGQSGTMAACFAVN